MEAISVRLDIGHASIKCMETELHPGQQSIRDVLWGELSVDRNSFISVECFFDLSELIVIGENASIAMRSVFITSTHEIGSLEKRAGNALAEPITIGDGCWIGANVTVLPNVRIGAGTIIAAGSVVTRDCDPNSVYAGVPAQKIKTL